MTSTNEKPFSSQPLPSYKKPPINEVVCGVKFRHSEKLLIPHFGCLWDKFKDEYPNIQHAQPISTESGDLQFDSATGVPIPRVWFINEPGDQLIQFQVDRFYYNWRRRENEYPRYGHVIKNFSYVMEAIEEFFKEYEFGELEITKCELTYINHIPVEGGVAVADFMSKIFKDFIWNSSAHQFLPAPKGVAWQSGFQLPGSNGEMIVSLRQGIRKDDRTPLFVLELKTLGPDDMGDDFNILEWFDIAREWIVRGFSEMTTDEIQMVWGREKDG